MRSLSIAGVLVTTLLALSAHGQPPDARQLKDQLTGDAKGAASGNPQCKLFTQAEIATYTGVAVGPGENAAGGSGCMWNDKDFESSATVTVVAARYFPEPKLVPGFRRLPDVGTRGWVAPDAGWSAGTLIKDEAVVVAVSGEKATEASAIALLKEVIKRRSR